MITVVHVVKDLIGVRIMKIIEKLSKIFKPHCPKCNSIMNIKFIDMTIDKVVYKCKKCGKEWI